MPPHTERVVVLVDMDCFYCQVEEKLDPNLAGKPIAVVQYNAWKGGGIIAVNYPARDRGVTRHMRGDEAKKMCPEIELVKVPAVRGKADLTKYREAGKRVAEVLQTFTTLLQRASVDEAYLDITEAVHQRLNNMQTLTLDQLKSTHVVGCKTEDFLYNVYNNEIKTDCNMKLVMGGAIVEEIRAAVYEKTGYRCSAGIAHNKILAKLACGLHKPNQQTILPQDGVPQLYETLPIKKIKNLGGKFGETLAQKLNINYMSELAQFSEQDLMKKFDEKTASWLYNIARGIDTEPVTVRLISKSIGCCKKFPGKNALRTVEAVTHWLAELALEISERLEQDLEENNRRAKQIILSFAQPVGRKDVHSSRTQALVSYDAKKITDECFETLKKHTQKSDGTFCLKFLGLSAGKFEDCKNMNSISTFFKPTAALNDCSEKNEAGVNISNKLGKSNEHTKREDTQNCQNMNSIPTIFNEMSTLNESSEKNENTSNKFGETEEHTEFLSNLKRENTQNCQNMNSFLRFFKPMSTINDSSENNVNSSNKFGGSEEYANFLSNLKRENTQNCKNMNSIANIFNAMSTLNESSQKNENTSSKFGRTEEHTEFLSNLKRENSQNCQNMNNIPNIFNAMSTLNESSEKNENTSNKFGRSEERTKFLSNLNRENIQKCENMNSISALIDYSEKDESSVKNENKSETENRTFLSNPKSEKTSNSKHENSFARFFSKLKHENTLRKETDAQSELSVNDIEDDCLNFEDDYLEATREVDFSGILKTKQEFPRVSDTQFGDTSNSFFMRYVQNMNCNSMAAKSIETISMNVQNDDVVEIVDEESGGLKMDDHEENSSIEFIMKQCPECCEKVVESEYTSHLDFHMAMKLMEEEKKMLREQQAERQGAARSPPKPLTKSKAVKRKSQAINVKNSISSYFSNNNLNKENKNTESCPECGKLVDTQEMASHMDFHAAKRLHLELNPVQVVRPPEAPINKKQKTSQGSSSIAKFLKPVQN